MHSIYVKWNNIVNLKILKAKEVVWLRKEIKSAFSLLLIIVVLFAAVLSAECTELNGETINVGDTVTYEIYVNAYPRGIQAVDVSLYYDSSVLELVPNSLEMPMLSGYLINTNLFEEIRFNALDVPGFDFSEGGLISRVQFKVIGTSVGNVRLSYEIKSFIDEDKIDLKDTLTYERTFVNNSLDTIPSSGEASDYDEDSWTETDGASFLEPEPNEDTDDSLSDSDKSFESVVSAAAVIESDSEELSEISSEIASSNEVDEMIAPNGISYRNFIIVVVAAVVVIFIIGLIFVYAVRAAKKGNHYS